MPRQVSDQSLPRDRFVFARAVRRVVRAIPVGGVASYAQVAARAGRPGAARAVGPLLSVEVPWWRVVRADGTLALGEGQAERLRAEGVEIAGRRITDARRRRSLRGGTGDAP